MDITNGEAAVKPRESRWMIAYHFYAGMCVASATSVVFQRHSIRLGAIPVVVALAVGYLASRTLVRAIERSRLSRRAKTACKRMLFLAYLPVVILLAFVIGNATLGI